MAEYQSQDPIVLDLYPQSHPQRDLHIGFPTNDSVAAEELAEAFREDGYDATVAFPAGGGGSIALWIASGAAGATALGKVLTAFFNKNQHRKITLKAGDKQLDAQGMSLRQLERLVQRALGQPDDDESG